MSIDNLYGYASDDDPFLLETKGSTFGGPDDTEDNGKFAFGGGSILPDGTINPENYAAVPAELYEKGVVTPGQKFKVTNPQTGATTIVVARDKGPSVKGRGIDLAPHAMDEIGGETDQPLVVDFRPISDVEEAVAQPFTMDSPTIDASPTGVSSAASPMKYFDPSEQGLSQLTPIGSGEPVTQVPPKQGDLSIVKTEPDGSKIFSNGYKVYPNGIIEMDAGDSVYQYLPGQTVPKVVPKSKQTQAKSPEQILEESAARKGIMKSDFSDEASFKKAAKNALDSTSGADDTSVEIAKAIASGNQPPDLKGMYRHGPAVRKALQDMGYNLTDAQQDWSAVQKHIATMEGPQQLRMRQAIDNTYHSLDVIEDLSKQWSDYSARGLLPILNRAQLALAKAGQLGKDEDSKKAAQIIATNLEAQIADVTSELGNVYMGGNSPTDHSLELAKKNLSADWSESQLHGALEQARRNLTIRDNSIKNTGSSRPDNRYESTPSPTPSATPSATPKFETGKIYRDGKGHSARYLGDGKWEEIK